MSLKTQDFSVALLLRNDKLCHKHIRVDGGPCSVMAG